ncbi:hypothetical protein RND81_11G024600 [Saponaria officinalis]|uniref:Uncharacterized protein n=1 Tax=Saponaria officinalis TaxID=3572 RepID=A0AAW1HG73_SAPOF
MAWSVVTTPTLSALQFINSSSTSSNSLFPLIFPHAFNNYNNNNYNYKLYTSNLKKQPLNLIKSLNNHIICRASEYKFPDPIPEFADYETEKFKTHMMDKLSKKKRYGDELEEVVGICVEILGKFLHEEYGGPGTLLVLPFSEMAVTVTENGLTGGPQAARAAVKWATANVDKDWKEWTNGNRSP